MRHQVDALVWLIERHALPTHALLHLDGDNTNNHIDNLTPGRVLSGSFCLRVKKRCPHGATIKKECRGRMSSMIAMCKNGGTHHDRHIRSRHGYTVDEFKAHISAQLQEGMTWANHGLLTWHVDHIKPVSIFIEEGCRSVKKINRLSNLQPLTAADNLAKGCMWGE